MTASVVRKRPFVSPQLGAYATKRASLAFGRRFCVGGVGISSLLVGGGASSD